MVLYTKVLDTQVTCSPGVSFIEVQGRLVSTSLAAELRQLDSRLYLVRIQLYDEQLFIYFRNKE